MAIVRTRLISFTMDRVASLRKIRLGNESDNMVERLRFALPVIAEHQTATLVITGRADLVRLNYDDENGYYVDLTAEIVGADGETEAYVRIDGDAGEAWSSNPFRLVTGELPDVDEEIEMRFPGAVETMLTEIERHRNEMQDMESRDDELSYQIRAQSPDFTVSGAAPTCKPLAGDPLTVLSHIDIRQEGSGDPSPSNVRPIVRHSQVSLTITDDEGQRVITHELAAPVIRGSYNWATGEIRSNVRIRDIGAAQAVETGTSSTGIKYVRLIGEGALTTMLACNRYKITTSLPTESGYIRIIGTAIYVYDNAIDFANPAVAYEGTEVVEPAAETVAQDTPTEVLAGKDVNTIVSSTGDTEVSGKGVLDVYSREEVDDALDLLAEAVPELDATLTQEGKAADAKAVGDKIGELSEEIGKSPTGKPRVYIDGVIPTTKDNVLAEMRVESSLLNFHAYIKIKCQGSSSMTYPKKNYTVTLYKDEARTIPLYITIPGWKHASNKYVLKANWVDPTHARNIITARLWSEVVASRPDYDSLPAEMRNSPNNGAIDGFPIIVTTNGTYQGIYTWNIGKEDWLWGMDENNPKHILLCGETNTAGTGTDISATNFREPWSGVHEDDWSVEVGENSEAVKDALNALTACLNLPEPQSKAQLDDYLDVQSAIDYDLLMCADRGVDSVARNMLLGTFNLKKWICGMYDLDSTWGQSVAGPQDPNDKHLGQHYNEQHSLLWERIEKFYAARLKERGRALRKTVLSYANIMGKFERFMDIIGGDAYADDSVTYPTIPSAEVYDIWQLRNFVRDRLVYFDTWLDGLPEIVLCEGITLDKTALNITGNNAVTIKATLAPVDCNDEIIWRSSNPAVVTVIGGVVTPVSDGSATITATCGSFVQTCSVVVTGVGSDSHLLYSLSAPATLAEGGEPIDTGVKLLNADKSFSIAIDYTHTEGQNASSILVGTGQVKVDASKTLRLTCTANPGNHIVRTGYSVTEWDNIMTVADAPGSRTVIVIRRAEGETTGEVVTFVNGERKTFSGSMDISRLLHMDCDTVILGARQTWSWSDNVYISHDPWYGTIHRCEIYDKYLSDDEVTAFIDGMN